MYERHDSRPESQFADASEIISGLAPDYMTITVGEVERLKPKNAITGRWNGPAQNFNIRAQVACCCAAWGPGGRGIDAGRRLGGLRFEGFAWFQPGLPRRLINKLAHAHDW